MSDYKDGFDKKKDNNFALIVVLFILLIIVGVSFVNNYY
ncbi:MAG: YjcZ family sporulation protein [Bacillota bacterium]